MIPKYDRKKLEDAQHASLNILLEVDRICVKHGLKYMMDSGTLLGAVRHQGFIPWDDDIDIAMTRANYETFKDIAGRELPDGMKLILPDEYRGGQAFYDFTPRIIYLNSKRHGKSEEMSFYDGKLNHLWVDIFILDNIPDNGMLDKLTRLGQKIIYGLAMSKRFKVDMDKYKGLSRLQVGVLRTCGRFCGMKRLFKAQEKLSVKYNNTRTKRLYYSNYQPDYLHDTIKREWIEAVIKIPFDGHMLMAPNGYHEVLTEIYGDYMQLPPEENRCPSHSDDIEVLG